MGKAALGMVVEDLPEPVMSRGGRPMKYPAMAELEVGQSLLLEAMDDLELKKLRNLAYSQGSRSSAANGRRCSYKVVRLEDGRVQVYRWE